MKRIKIVYRISAIALFLTLLLVACETPRVSHKFYEIKSADLLGEWGGFSDDGVYHILNLQPNGIGTFGYVSYRGKPIVLKIANWRCEKKHVIAFLEAASLNPDAVQKVEGRAGLLTMILAVSGQGWERPAVFVREEVRDRQRRAVEARIGEYEKKTVTETKGADDKIVPDQCHKR